MIVADGSGLVSLATARVLERALATFDVHTTEFVLDGLEDVSSFHGPAGDGARRVIGHADAVGVHRGGRGGIETSRVDPGQGSCAALATDLDADVLLTDDLLAVPELDRIVPGAIAGTPHVLAALVRQGVLPRQDARFRLEELAATRDWLGRPVVRRVRASLDEQAID